MAFEQINGYEVLQICGDFGLQVGISYARFKSDAGQGYRSAVLVDGAVTGLKSWKLNYKALRQTLDSPAFYYEDEFTKADYLWDFYCRHQVSGLPFIIRDPRNDQNYLADFTDEIFSLELVQIKLWSTGLNLLQRRVTNVSVFDLERLPGQGRWYDASSLDLADGADVESLDGVFITDDFTDPSIPLEFSMTSSEETLDLETEWIGSTDTGTGVDYYELEITLGE